MKISSKKVCLSFAVFLAVFLLAGCENNPTAGQQNKSTNPANVQQLQQPAGNSGIQTQEVPSATSCGAGYYKNVDGNCVHSPSDNPSGATAKCRDGSYSYSQHRQGTCSGHGGVAEWL